MVEKTSLHETHSQRGHIALRSWRAPLPFDLFSDFLDHVDESAPMNPLYAEAGGKLYDLGLLMALPWGAERAFFPGHVLMAETARRSGNEWAARTALFANAYLSTMDKLPRIDGWASAAICLASSEYAEVGRDWFKDRLQELKKLINILEIFPEWFPSLTVEYLGKSNKKYQITLDAQRRRGQLMVIT